jgi:arsenite methyltransferase
MAHMDMHEQVKAYYGQVLKGTSDLQTTACCTGADAPPHVQEVLADIHEEVASRYYGCGFVVPHELDGMRVLDLGCGSGRDCFVLSRLVGERGHVVGVEMTPEQLAVAERHVDFHMRRYGYARPNVEFRLGYIERLDELGLEDDSFDVIVSNCVINLSPDKAAVLRQAHRLLKRGGEIYFSDVYADRRVPSDLASDPVLYGECLGGALYWNDFVNLAKGCGFPDPRLVEDRPLAVNNVRIAHRLGALRFFSATYRLFKLAELEPACEDYGQAVIYRGTVPQAPDVFVLDKHHRIERGKVFPVCGNTFRMLRDSRFSGHFEFLGSWETHYGIFAGCGMGSPFEADRPPDLGGSCC